MSDNFKKTILEWNTIQQRIKETNEQIAPFQKRIKSYKDKAENLENQILEYMVQNNMNKSKIELGDVVITMGESKRTESVTRDYLLTKAKEFFKNDIVAEKFVSFVYDKRRQTISNCLKRKAPRKST